MAGTVKLPLPTVEIQFRDDFPEDKLRAMSEELTREIFNGIMEVIDTFVLPRGVQVTVS